MHDRRDGGNDRGRSRHERGHDQRQERRGDERRGNDRRDERGERDQPQRGGGPDTRFLQLEMSQVLYGEAEALTRQAFREVLLEAAKQRLRERFGDQLAGLAQLAVDDLMNDVLDSLEVEARIQERSEDRDRNKERLREIFADRGHDHDHEDCDHDHGPESAGDRDEPGGEGGDE